MQRNTHKSSSFLKRLLLAGTLALTGCLSNLEKRVEQEYKPKSNITVNYNIESESRGVDYLISKAIFYQSSGTLNYLPNILKLSSSEETQIENILNDIKLENINSYQNFVESTETLSENQKIVLLGAIGGLLGEFNYEDLNGKVVSQNIFFNKLQDSLKFGNQNGLGLCRHIHSHVEQLANDFRIEAAAVTGVSWNGGGQVFTIVKTEKGGAVIEYNNILTTNTNNIENVLEVYQKWNGTTTFKHDFFEDVEFKYRLITKDGRHFLDFVGYDESLNLLNKILIEDIKDGINTTFTFNQGNYLNSFGLNHQDLFIRIGNILGNTSSPMKNTELLQGGYDGKFTILNTLNIDGNISFIYGTINQDKNLDKQDLLGVTGNLIASTNKGAFNFGFKVGGSGFLKDNIAYSNLFYDFSIGMGTSYKFTTEKLNIKPYVGIQYSAFPEDIGTMQSKFIFNEFCIGSLFDIKIPNSSSFLVKPYYTKRLWEKEFGMDMSYSNKNLKLSFGAYTTESDYEFSPSKEGYSIGLSTTLRNSGIGFDYKGEKVNYNGEKENRESLNIKFYTKF